METKKKRRKAERKIRKDRPVRKIDKARREIITNRKYYERITRRRKETERKAERKRRKAR